MIKLEELNALTVRKMSYAQSDNDLSTRMILHIRC